MLSPISTRFTVSDGVVEGYASLFGDGNLSRSTLLRRLNAGNRDGAALEFHRWNRAAGKVLKGLVRRRASEALMFQGIADLDFDGMPDGPMPQAVDATDL